MKFIKKACFLLICSCLLLTTAPVFANSAAPPLLIVIVPFPPEDLELYLLLEDGSKTEPFTKTQTAWEAQFKFFYHNLPNPKPSLENADLIAATAGVENRYLIPSSLLGGFSNVISLNLKNHSLTSGKTLLRSITLVSLRVGLTLLIEGLVFLFYGYHQRKSWTAFLKINLLTQGALNIWLNSQFAHAYLLFALIFYEIIIFLAETVLFIFLTDEKGRLKTTAYAFSANFFSFILGGFLITLLPV